MSATEVRAPRRQEPAKRGRVLLGRAAKPRPAGAGAGVSFIQSEDCCEVELGDSKRLALLLTPKGRGAFREQALEVFSAARGILEQQTQPMSVTMQTIFLRSAGDQPECERILASQFGAGQPVTNFVLQAPCAGAALALEAWAIGGKSARVERYGPHTLAVGYDGVRWVYCAGITPARGGAGVYGQALEGLEEMRADLVRAGSGFERVLRTWFYLGGITAPEGATRRYQELNRARSDFYRTIPFGHLLPKKSGDIYPASTGIGMAGADLVMSCVTLQTERKDTWLAPLENPQQTPAYAYNSSYSPQTPKFSRAMALVLGHYVTTWVSGTASIVHSESCHVGDVAAQTEQTIDNIERLIGPQNFAAHGVRGAGAGLHDLAKIRVYLKRPEDFDRCRAICQRRFGAVPAIYAVADICRPELLVEIEGVAFSAYATAGS